MPIYEYRCENGHTFEVIQSMSDDPVSECEVCGEPVERVFHPVAVHFKGSGFYTTDYAKKAASGSASSGDSGSSKSDSSSSAEGASKSEGSSSESSGSGSGSSSSGSESSSSGSESSGSGSGSASSSSDSS